MEVNKWIREAGGRKRERSRRAQCGIAGTHILWEASWSRRQQDGRGRVWERPREALGRFNSLLSGHWLPHLSPNGLLIKTLHWPLILLTVKQSPHAAWTMPHYLLCPLLTPGYPLSSPPYAALPLGTLCSSTLTLLFSRCTKHLTPLYPPPPESQDLLFPSPEWFLIDTLQECAVLSLPQVSDKYQPISEDFPEHPTLNCSLHPPHSSDLLKFVNICMIYVHLTYGSSYIMCMCYIHMLYTIFIFTTYQLSSGILYIHVYNLPPPMQLQETSNLILFIALSLEP